MNKINVWTTVVAVAGVFPNSQHGDWSARA